MQTSTQTINNKYSPKIPHKGGSASASIKKDTMKYKKISLFRSGDNIPTETRRFFYQMLFFCIRI